MGDLINEGDGDWRSDRLYQTTYLRFIFRDTKFCNAVQSSLGRKNPYTTILKHQLLRVTGSFAIIAFYMDYPIDGLIMLKDEIDSRFRMDTLQFERNSGGFYTNKGIVNIDENVIKIQFDKFDGTSIKKFINSTFSYALKGTIEQLLN